MPKDLDTSNDFILVARSVLVAPVAHDIVGPLRVRIKVLVAQNLSRWRTTSIVFVAEKIVSLINEVKRLLGIGHGGWGRVAVRGFI